MKWLKVIEVENSCNKFNVGLLEHTLCVIICFQYLSLLGFETKKYLLTREFKDNVWSFTRLVILRLVLYHRNHLSAI